jgi:peptidoglycan/LPS O-acetylase OafA/YrhL
MSSADDLSSLAAAAAAANARVSTSSYAMEPIAGAFCTSHPGSPAVCYCQTCRAPVCATCVFVFPGGIQLCPACASNPRPQISPRRQRLVWWSVGLAIWCVLGLIAMVVLVRQNPTSKANAEAIGTAFVFLTLLPSIVGVALGVATFDRRLSTPGIVWVGIIGNGLVLLIWVLLMIVGAMR